MKRILSLFVVLLFVVGCGGGSDDSASMPEVENSPDFEEIEIPSSFETEPVTDDLEIPDADAVPEEVLELVEDALTIEASRTELTKKIREASFCNALDDVSDKEIWKEMVYQFNLDELASWGRNLEDALRNLLAYDLDLELDEPEEIEFYGDTLEVEEVWSILADEVDGLDTSPGQCS